METSVEENNGASQQDHQSYSLETIIDDIMKVLVEDFSLEKSKVTSDTADMTFEKLGLDSLDQADLVMKLEDVYGISLSDGVLDSILTPGTAAREIYAVMHKEKS